MIVVADAGPLIHLAAIGQSDLVRRLSAEVLVPQAVFHEVVVTGAGLPGAAEVESATWITVVTATRADLVKALMSSGLHRGESEAITVAVERGADCVLIDERQGRLSAEAMGLAVVGSIGRGEGERRHQSDRPVARCAAHVGPLALAVPRYPSPPGAGRAARWSDWRPPRAAWRPPLRGLATSSITRR